MIKMRKIINKKLYDTETATYISDYTYGTPRDFSYVSESLYQKRTGELFLHAEGGPMSKYGKSYGDNSWGYGEEIIPAADFDVKEWVSQYCDAETYIKLFGPVSE